MDLGDLLPPEIPFMEGKDDTSAKLLTMSEFERYRARSRKLTKDEDDEYFSHQRIVRQYMIYNDHLLLIHDAGTGKTRTAWGFAMEILNGLLNNIYRKIVIATPSEILHSNWKSSPEYALFPKGVVELVTHYQLSTLDPNDYPGTVFIIDEAHVATSGKRVPMDFDRNDTTLRNTGDTGKQEIYLGMWNILHNTTLHKVLLLTATPMQNSVMEFYPLMNLILPTESQITKEKLPLSDDALLDLMSGRVSYVRTAEEDVSIRYTTNLKSLQLTQILNGGSICMGHVSIVPNKWQGVPLKTYPVIRFDRYLESEELVEVVVYDPSLETVMYREGEESLLEFRIVDEQRLEIRSDQTSGYWATYVPITYTSTLDLEQRMEVIESYLSPSHTLTFSGRLDEIVNDPLNDNGLSITNTKMTLMEVTPENLVSFSGLYSTIIYMFLSSLSEECRGRITPTWQPLFETLPPQEVGKNILYLEFVDINYGGIERLGDLLTKIGYQPLKIIPGKKQLSDYGKAPRFIINPRADDLELFNHPDNWDGSYVQLSMFSSQGAKGISYLDVRHIHLIPHWSPAENTQAVYRGIRAKSHDNLRAKLGTDSLEVRVYKHISTPMPANVTYNNDWISNGVTIDNIRYYGDESDQAEYLHLEPFDSFQDYKKYDQSMNNFLRILAKDNQSSVQDPFEDFQFTILGFGMSFIPNPSKHPKMREIKDLRPPPRENYPAEIRETFFSPLAYRFAVATEKDFSMAQIRRLYKVAAMDCDLNKLRNILPEQYDNTELCDYRVCKYVCLPDQRGLEIVIDSADPETGLDPRWERDNWVPFSTARATTVDRYFDLPLAILNRVVSRIRSIFKNLERGFMSYWNLIVQLREEFSESKVSELQFAAIISDIMFSQLNVLEDIFGNPCLLKVQGEILYLCPLYTSERSLYIKPEGVIMGRYMHGTNIRLISDRLALEDFIGKLPSKQELINNYLSNSDVEAFDLQNFEDMVELVEGAYLHYLETGMENRISKRFGKYFFETTVQEINKIRIPGNQYVTPILSPWSPNDNRRVLFHVLYHIHPSATASRRTLSDNVPIKYMLENGFNWATESERTLLYNIASDLDVKNILALTEKSKTTSLNGIIGIIDDSKFRIRERRDKMEYFKIYDPVGKEEETRNPQGRVCMTMDSVTLNRIVGLAGLPEMQGDKVSICNALYNKLVGMELVR